jgi:hypothetical protein
MMPNISHTAGREAVRVSSISRPLNRRPRLGGQRGWQGKPENRHRYLKSRYALRAPLVMGHAQTSAKPDLNHSQIPDKFSRNAMSQLIVGFFFTKN